MCDDEGFKMIKIMKDDEYSIKNAFGLLTIRQPYYSNAKNLQ